MKKIIQQLQTKPPQVRLAVAGVLALGATGIVALGWIMTPTTTSRASTKTPGPLQAITQTIKTGTEGMPNMMGDTTVEKKSQVEIINTTAQSQTMFDESNPYQVETTSSLVEPLSDSNTASQ